MSNLVDLPSLAEFAPDPFADTLQRVRSVYDAVGTAVGVERQVMEEQRERSERESPDSFNEWEHQIFDDWKHDLDECNKIRCGMALVVLNSALKSLAHESNIALARPKKRTRDPWTVHFKHALAARNIDVSSAPGWDRIEEVSAARNKMEHPRGDVRQNRYLNGEGDVDFSQEVFDATLSRLEEFAKWWRKRLREDGGLR